MNITNITPLILFNQYFLNLYYIVVQWLTYYSRRATYMPGGITLTSSFIRSIAPSVGNDCEIHIFERV